MSGLDTANVIDCHAHVRIEVDRLATHQLAIDGERFQRIFLRHLARLFETLASARRAEYAKRFGAKGEKLENMLAAAENAGATTATFFIPCPGNAFSVASV